MFGRRDDILEKLIGTQHEEVMANHEETMSYLRNRDEEMRKEFQRRDEEMREEFQRRDEEMREFNREILLRNEKVYTAMIAQMEKNTARIHSGTEETRAQTKALLKVIDRLDGLAA